MDALQMAGFAAAIALLAGLPAYIATQREIGRFRAAAFAGTAIGGVVGFALALAAIKIFCPMLDSAGVFIIGVIGSAFAGAVLGGYGGAARAAITGTERKSAVSGAIVGLITAVLLALLALAVFSAELRYRPMPLVAVVLLCLVWLCVCIGILAGARVGAIRSEGPERIRCSLARLKVAVLVVVAILAILGVFAVMQVVSQRYVEQATRASSTPPTGHIYRVWTRPFRTQDTARRAAATLAGRGFQAGVITTHNQGRTEYAVHLGAFADRNRAEATAAAARSAGYGASVF